MKWVVYLFFAICVVFHWFAAGCKSNCPPGMIAHVHHWSLGPNFWTTEATLLGNCFWWSSTDLCLDTTVLLSSGAIFGCRWPFTCICWCLLPLPFRKAHGMLGCNFTAFRIRILYFMYVKKRANLFPSNCFNRSEKILFSSLCEKRWKMPPSSSWGNMKADRQSIRPMWIPLKRMTPLCKHHLYLINATFTLS